MPSKKLNQSPNFNAKSEEVQETKNTVLWLVLAVIFDEIAWSLEDRGQEIL